MTDIWIINFQIKTRIFFDGAWNSKWKKHIVALKPVIRLFVTFSEIKYMFIISICSLKALILLCSCILIQIVQNYSKMCLVIKENNFVIDKINFIDYNLVKI